MKSHNFDEKTAGRVARGLYLAAALLVPLSPALAVGDTFVVGSGLPENTENFNPVVNYTQRIEATNFLCEEGSSFIWVTNTASTSLSSYYQNWNWVQNYTNIGWMESSTGFRFDTYKYYADGSGTTAHVPAANFVNYGNIFGNVYVLATNIYHSGTFHILPDGRAELTGDAVQFDRGDLVMQSAVAATNLQPTISATGQTGQRTGGWNPFAALNAATAYGPMNAAPFILGLTNHAAYFDIRTTGGTNFIVRMIFIEDHSVNVDTNIYFTGFGGDGSAHVEWVGTYTDSDGTQQKRYLYLVNNYMEGSSTNALNFNGQQNNGIPNNFTFIASPTRIPLGIPAAAGFLNIIENINVTSNIYSYVDAKLLPGTVAPGSGTVWSNMLGSVKLSAKKSLNLSLSTISGMNYVLLNSPNHFETDGMSSYAAPYADMFLGSTNGNLTVANLVQSQLPMWSGNVKAWTTRWIATNSFGASVDYRILLVSSRLKPVSQAQIQDFVLNSSDNVVISDQLNIARNFSLNCTNLLLTTNAPGSLSACGELNLLNATNRWETSVPRLRCLTNNGIITTINTGNYGNSTLPYLSLVNWGAISNAAGVNITSRNFENYGSFTSGTNNFIAKTTTTTLMGGSIKTASTLSLQAESLVISGTRIECPKTLTLTATNLLTDLGPTNGGVWAVGAGYAGYGQWTGLNMPIKPAAGDLLGTTITNTAVDGTKIINIWAGRDMGASVSGFSNNAAVGKLILNAQGAAPRTAYEFRGNTTGSAMYVDCLQLINLATNYNASWGLLSVSNNPNIVIYYAQALMGDISVAEKLDGKNGGRLRWIKDYAGEFSSITLTNSDGSTYRANGALRNSTSIDSDGDGIVNADDSTPFAISFSPAAIKLSVSTVKTSALQSRIRWNSPPAANNRVEYATTYPPTTWLLLTNFVTPSVAATNIVSVSVDDPVKGAPRFYRVVVQPR